MTDISGNDEKASFVEELADEHDYWLSLTDAARVTRTSEAMARRWVTSGRLPVKKEPAGINQRTRLVRASDVARIRPIVDTTAAITDDVHKLDLLSIPRQQAHIVQEQQSLTASAQEMQQTLLQFVDETHTSFGQMTTHMQQQAAQWGQRLDAVREQQQHLHETLAAQVQSHAQTLERIDSEVAAQDKQHRHTLEQLRLFTRESLNHLQALLQDAQAQLERQLLALDQDHRAHLDQTRQAYNILLQQQQEHVAHALVALEETLADYARQHTHLQDNLAALHQEFANSQTTLTILIEQRVREAKTALEQPISTLQHDGTTFQERLSDIIVRQEQLSTQVSATHDASFARATMQDQRIQELTSLLQDEIKTRTRLTARLDEQQEQIQALRSQIEGAGHVSTQSHTS